MDPSERVKLFNDAIVKWFGANKLRFPEWAPNDPLPHDALGGDE